MSLVVLGRCPAIWHETHKERTTLCLCRNVNAICDLFKLHRHEIGHEICDG